MFKFFGFGRSKNTDADAAVASQPPDQQNLTQQHTDIQRELVRVVLKDTLRLHGIPAGWIGCELTVMSRRARNRDIGEDLFVHLTIMKWNEALLRYAPALQQQLIEGLNRFEPNVDHSRHIVSWRFAANCECPFARMPAPQFWAEAQAQPRADVLAPVAATPSSPATPALPPLADAAARRHPPNHSLTCRRQAWTGCRPPLRRPNPARCVEFPDCFQ